MSSPPLTPDIAYRNRLLDILVAGARHWAHREAVDLAAMTAVRHAAILMNHEAYVRQIPAYAQIAEERGLADQKVDDVATIARELMFPTDLFKSYDLRWLAAPDFEAMNSWVRTIFHCAPDIATDDLQTIVDWRLRLRDDGIYLSYSSGTGGQLSFVPRDTVAWTALVRNGRHASHVSWDGASSGYDCLVLGPRGTGMGMQSAGTGLARAAIRAHYLFDTELDADMLMGLQQPGNAQIFRAAITADRDEAYERCFRFLEESQTLNRRVLVYGPPYEVAELCTRIVARKGGIRLPEGSIVNTGGGWKAREPISRDAIAEQLREALGVAREQIFDTYSTTECNCAFMTCPEGRYHIPPLIEPVIVDDLMMPLTGQDLYGTIGFLDPFAVSYPGFLITGDEGHLVYDRCACGLDGWAFVDEIRRQRADDVKGCAGVLASALT